MTPPTKIDFLNVNDLISLTNLPGQSEQQSESLDQHIFK